MLLTGTLVTAGNRWVKHREAREREESGAGWSITALMSKLASPGSQRRAAH